MILGFIIVKLKVVKSNDSLVLSKISIYLLMPAAIINSFNIEMSSKIMTGLALAFGAALTIHIVFLIIDSINKKILGCSGLERASIMYPNSGNLIIPIVSFILGEEWVIYSCAFLSVQIVFMWTHGIRLFSPENKFNIKKILLNSNIISVFIGVALIISGFQLPKFAVDITSSLGGMIGNVGMLIAGMMAAEVDFKKMFKNKRLYLVLIMRMIICPAVFLVILKTASAVLPIADANKILLITYLASITPSAATVMQFAKIHNTDPDYSVAINIVTTLACSVTMPLFVSIF